MIFRIFFPGLGICNLLNCTLVKFSKIVNCFNTLVSKNVMNIDSNGKIFFTEEVLDLVLSERYNQTSVGLINS